MSIKTDRAPAATTFSISIMMAGSGNADFVLELEVGRYQCDIDLKNNVQGERPAQFRLQFLSQDPIAAPLVTWDQPSWDTTVAFAFYGSEGADTGRVEVKIRAAAVSEWSLRCDKGGEIESAPQPTTVRVFYSLTSDGSLVPNVIISGTGATPAIIPARDGTYRCQIKVSNIVTEAGSAAVFAIEIDQVQVADVVATEWSGVHEFVVVTDADNQVEPAGATTSAATSVMEGRGPTIDRVVPVGVTATATAEWEINGVPQQSGGQPLTGPLSGAADARLDALSAGLPAGRLGRPSRAAPDIRWPARSGLPCPCRGGSGW